MADGPKVRKLYRVLGVTPDISDAELKEAYHAAALKWHPDRHGAAAREDAEFKFREAQGAFDDLVSHRQQFGNSASSYDPLKNSQRARAEQRTRDSSRSHDVRSGHRAAGPPGTLPLIVRMSAGCVLSDIVACCD